MKGYSNYNNPNAKRNNEIPVRKGSVIVSNLSNYEKLPKTAVDHKRESVVVIKKDQDLGVVYLHGVKDRTGKSRNDKVEKGLLINIKKNGQDVLADLNIKTKDANGRPIRQGKIFQNTGSVIDAENMKKIEDHIYKPKKRGHSIRITVSDNRKISNDMSKKKKV